jgi:16S rRNA processing protein RimM
MGFCQDDGELVPFQVAEESVIQKDSSHLIVGFEGITDQPAARDLIGKMCNLPGARTDWFGKESTTEKTLTGYQVTEEVSGFQGVVTEFRDIPGNPLLEILFDGKNVLVPANPAFIVEVNDKAKHLILRIPPDLLNL